MQAQQRRNCSIERYEREGNNAETFPPVQVHRHEAFWSSTCIFIAFAAFPRPMHSVFHRTWGERRKARQIKCQDGAIVRMHGAHLMPMR
jgi:hypothetical protein